MGDAIEEMVAGLGSQDEFIEADLRFHLIIAEASPPPPRGGTQKVYGYNRTREKAAALVDEGLALLETVYHDHPHRPEVFEAIAVA